MTAIDPTPRVELLVRAGCHLCEAARQTVEKVTGSLGLGWTELDVDADPALLARYSEEIPVLLIDGVQRDFWVIDPLRLRALLVG
ncbi:glutaredoxin family protein [Paeniglutamicibacter cryotolerans]|uniref:Glutaredoxin n=1 Tax=Paeniglutamicibacter cryotolerans TaxID=670079 RepID=A0A839QLY0_9MICC|nr:glutaredoxin family protein [Paeniglutamicibacter cryotolerans]MBB2994202.1 glutaredoxin [Paeniglutamicibacter cryotolerans]